VTDLPEVTRLYISISTINEAHSRYESAMPCLVEDVCHRCPGPLMMHTK
jgi:hypothetical protein